MDKIKKDNPEMKTSQSFSSLPRHLTKNPAYRKILMDQNEARSQSEPSSPQEGRRAFTTCIGGTRYLIGKANLENIFVSCNYVYSRHKMSNR